VTLTPRLVNMVAIFVAAASAAANNNKNNNYSGKLKRKTATTSLLKTVFQISFQRWATTPAQSSRGHRGVATHSLEPCKVSLPGLKKTQHKATHKLHTAGKLCTFLTKP
jgi:hypothetical protein